MKQVAVLAGLGTKTVSRVINNEPNVSAETAARVWDAVRVLEYQVDMQAGSLRRADGRTLTLGLLISSVANPFAGEMHRGVEDVAMARNVAVFASSSDEDPAREAAAVNDFLRRRMDGLILATNSLDVTHLGSALRRGVPIAFVDRRPAGLVADCVSSDNRAAGAMATRHLLERGHRRIALLTERARIPTAVERQQGFLDELGRAGVPTGEATIITGLTGSESAERALTVLLTSASPPTAVFGAQNLIGIGALRALHALGLQRDVALIGFDDFPLADLVQPGMTVVRQNPEEIGRVAAERVFRRLEGEALPVEQITIPTELVERGSGEIRPRDC